MNTLIDDDVAQVPAPDDVKTAAWAGVASLSLGVFALVTAEFLPASLLTPMSQDLGVSVGAAGQSVTMTAIVGAIAGPAVVIGTSRWDRRATLLVLTALLVVSSLMAAFASGLPMLLLSRALLGIGLGGFWAMSLALAMRLVPGRLMPRAMAIIMTGVSLATVCAAPLGAWIGEAYGWRTAFGIAAALGIVAFVMQATSLSRRRPRGAWCCVSVSLFLADAQTTVLPLRMFALIEESLDVRVAAMSGILIGLTLVVMLVARRVLAPARQA